MKHIRVSLAPIYNIYPRYKIGIDRNPKRIGTYITEFMLDDKEKEQLVKKLLDEEKSYRDIMRIAQVSPSTIKKVRVQLIRARTPPAKSNRLKAFEIFDSQNPRGWNVYQVVTELDIPVEDAEKYQTEYLKLNHRDELALVLQDKSLFGLIPVYREMQSRRLTVDNLKYALTLSTSLGSMEARHRSLSTAIRSAQERMSRLDNEIVALDRQSNALKRDNASLANLNEILKQQVSSSQQAIDKFRSSDLVPIVGIVNAIGRSMLEDQNLLLGAAAASIVKTLASDPSRVSNFCNPAAVEIFVSYLLDPGSSGNENELSKLARNMLGIYSDFLAEGILQGTIKTIADSNYKNYGERVRAKIDQLATLQRYSPFLASLLTHQ